MRELRRKIKLNNSALDTEDDGEPPEEVSVRRKQHKIVDKQIKEENAMIQHHLLKLKQSWIEKSSASTSLEGLKF